MSVFFTKRGEPPSIGKRASDYAVGDVVKLIEDGAETEYIVIHQGIPDATIYDSSCNGTWVLRKDVADNQQWNTSNVNDYENSAINLYLNSTILNKFSANIQGNINQVKIPYRAGSGIGTTTSSGSSGLSTKVFLLSYAELGFSEDAYHPLKEGICLSYFVGTSGDSYDAKRVANLNGSPVSWYTRTPYCYYSLGQTTVLTVDTGGRGSTVQCISSCGVRPAIVLNSNTRFDSNTNVIKG